MKNNTNSQKLKRVAATVILFHLCLVSSIMMLPKHTIHAEPDSYGHGLIPDAAPAKQVAIVIDDFGNRMQGTEQMLQLPIKITVAVMPFMPTSKQDAEAAHRYGHDVIVHMPMEPKHGNPKWLGPGALTSNLSDAEIEARVRNAIDSIPYCVGMNNHMGSKVTADKRIMRIVLKVCKEKGMFFLDSRTNYRSIVGEVGRELGVPVMNNHLFLDDENTESHVTKQWNKVEHYVQKQSPFIVIGHVGAGGLKTSAVLHRVLPSARERIHFVRASELRYNPPPPMFTQ